MMSVKEVREWLDALPDDELIGIDEGGLCLVHPDSLSYCEVGGIPDEAEVWQ